MKKSKNKALKNAAPKTGVPIGTGVPLGTPKAQEIKKEETTVAVKPVEKTDLVKKPIEETKVAVKPIEKTDLVKKPIEETKVAVKPIEKTDLVKKPIEETKVAVKPVEKTDLVKKPVEETKVAEVKAEPKTEVKAETPKKEPAKKATKAIKATKKATTKDAAKKAETEKAANKAATLAPAKRAKKATAAKAAVPEVTNAVADVEIPTPVEVEIEVAKEPEQPPKFKVAIVGSECAPFAKTGGLADVIGALPKALNALDVEVSVFVPFHKIIKDKYRLETQHITFFYINLGWRTKFVGVEKLVRDNITYYFIDNEDYFGGPIYLGQQPEGEQYAFFTRAVLEAMLHMDYTPDVIHVNDWQTAMIPMLLRTQYQATALNGTKTLLTIHNMMYQGMYGFDFVQSLLGIDARYYTPEFMEANGCANFMKGGIVFANKISTVSPTYALELKDPYYAYGLEGILNARANDTVGILNGIDTDENNPETDTHIPVHFSKNDLSGKLEDKRILMEKLGLHFNKDTPLIGMVSRLTSQKGFDLIKSIFHELMTQNVSIVLLGTGDKEYEAFFGKMESEYKGRVCSYIGYNNEVAHQIYAGCDLFLMPSKFEPCGLSQMLAQRYGALPIARETGGLKDTVIPFNEYTGEGNGFTFTNYNSHDMLDIIKYALYCFNDKNKRDCLIKNAMECDNSFAVSAQKYLDLYKSL